MIFLTVGGDLAFSRLVQTFDMWCKAKSGSNAFAQIGQITPTDYIPVNVEWAGMMPADEYANVSQQASVFVAHAGMGSIITALSLGKPIVILPRRVEFQEHRNDHQLATAKHFQTRPGVFVAWREADLEGRIDEALLYAEDSNMEKMSRFAPDSLTDRLRSFILGGL